MDFASHYRLDEFRVIQAKFDGSVRSPQIPPCQTHMLHFSLYLPTEKFTTHYN
jgi:hypothetical protein